MTRRHAWAVPALVAAGIAAAAAAPHALASDPHPALPQRTPAQLITAAEQAHVAGISGDFRTVADLGLPDLPGSDAGGSQWLRVLTGTADWHVWDRGLTSQRLALLGEGREIDTIDDDGIFWVWNSATQTATREIVKLPAARNRRNTGPAATLPRWLSRPGDLTPMRLARDALHSVGPSTRVSVGPTARVAGRPAYTLVLAPRTPQTLVGQVRIAVDAATGEPLQVQLVPRGSDLPAFTAGFTSVSLGPVRPGIFHFRPPPGAKVRVTRLFGADRQADRQPRIIGSGWAAVVSERGSAVRPTALVRDATHGVPGGRLLQTRLFTVRLADDGRMLAGAVPPSRLEQIAGQTPPQAPGSGSATRR